MKRLIMFMLTFMLVLQSVTAYATEWVCPKCGRTNTGNFCPDCGTKYDPWICQNCGKENLSLYCENCGTQRPEDSTPLNGTWQFTVLRNPIYIAFYDDSHCLVKMTDEDIAKGTYSIQNETLFISPDYLSPISGSFAISDDGLMSFSAFGTGKKIDDNAKIPYIMKGSSMIETITDGQSLTIEHINSSHINRFDLVAVHFPNRENTIFVKRIVGLPGDKVAILNGYLYVNGVQYDEEYVNDEYRSGSGFLSPETTVPDNTYYVLGDHRNNSNDSRYIGPIPADMMIGIVNTSDIP